MGPGQGGSVCAQVGGVVSRGSLGGEAGVSVPYKTF